MGFKYYYPMVEYEKDEKITDTDTIDNRVTGKFVRHERTAS